MSESQIIKVDSRSKGVALTTILASLFNLLLVGVVCLGVVPKINTCIVETDKNREAIVENHEFLKSNWKELEGHREVIRKLADRLEKSAARSEKANRDFEDQMRKAEPMRGAEPKRQP